MRKASTDDWAYGLLVALALLLAVGAGMFSSRPAPEPPRETPVPITQPTPEIPHIPTIPADPAPTVHPHWGACSPFVGLQANEDAALVEVLSSQVQDDPLFGGRKIRMEMASCSAYRERCAWMGCS